MEMLIRGGRIHDAVHPVAYAADILVRDGKIAAIGAAEMPAGVKIQSLHCQFTFT